jgi:hypothetical protein
VALTREHEPYRRLLSLAAEQDSSPPRVDTLDATTTSAQRLDRRAPAVADLQVAPLRAAMAGRRLARRFDLGTVSAAQLGLVVQAGLSADQRQWPLGPHHDLGLAVVLAALRVTDLPRGLHLAAPGADRSFVRLGNDHWVGELADAYADAPVLLLVCGDLDRACLAVGPRGYGQLLVRAGAVGHAAWLAATELGLAGSVFGVRHPKVTASVGRASSGSLSHLFTVALGGSG